MCLRKCCAINSDSLWVCVLFGRELCLVISLHNNILIDFLDDISLEDARDQLNSAVSAFVQGLHIAVDSELQRATSVACNLHAFIITYFRSRLQSSCQILEILFGRGHLR